MFYSRIIAGVLVAAFVSTPALASDSRNVYLNGENINTLRSQTFEDVTVKIDDKGNITIESDKYLIHTEKKGTVSGRTLPVIQQEAAGSAAQVAGTGPEVTGVLRGGGHYYLVSEENVPGHAQYTFDLFVNGNFVKTVKSGDAAILEDVTKHLTTGKNQVIVKATKSMEGGRRSSDANVYMKIYIAKGKKGDNNAIFMENPVWQFKRTASQIDNSAQQMHFEVK